MLWSLIAGSVAKVDSSNACRKKLNGEVNDANERKMHGRK